MAGKAAKKTRDLLREDVGAMIRDYIVARRKVAINSITATEALADDIIIVVRERVLQEIQSYARQNIR